MERLAMRLYKNTIYHNMSSVLGGSRNISKQVFKDLYNLWFDKKGEKTKYFIILEDNKVNLSNVSATLHRTGAKAKQTFEDLFNLWFDEGEKTKYLRTLEKKME